MHVIMVAWLHHVVQVAATFAKKFGRDGQLSVSEVAAS